MFCCIGPQRVSICCITNVTGHLWYIKVIPDKKVHGANMGPTWGRQNPGGPHVGPMNFVIWDIAWVSCHLKSTPIKLIEQQLVQTCNKENIEGVHYWPFVRGIHWWMVEFQCKGQKCGYISILWCPHAKTYYPCYALCNVTLFWTVFCKPQLKWEDNTRYQW